MKIYEGNCVNTQEEIEGKVFKSPDGITISEIPVIGWEIIDPPTPQLAELEVKIINIDSLWKQNPQALQDYYEVQYNKVKSFLLNGEKDKALEYMNTLVILIPEQLQPTFKELITVISEL